MAKKGKSKLRELIEEYGIKDLKDVQEFVKALTAKTIQEVLEGELETSWVTVNTTTKTSKPITPEMVIVKKPHKVAKEKSS